MPPQSNNDILLKLGIDQEGLDSMSASVGKAIANGIANSLKGLDLGKSINDALTGGGAKGKLDMKTVVINEGVIEKTRQQIEFLQKILVDLKRTTDEAAKDAKPFEQELNNISEAFRKIVLENEALNKARVGSGLEPVGFNDTQIKNFNKLDLLISSLQTKMRDFANAASAGGKDFIPTIDQLNARSQALRITLNEEVQSLESLRAALASEGVEKSKVEKLTQSFQQAIISSKVRLDQLDESLKSDKPDLDAIGRSFNNVGVQIDTTGRKMQEMDAKQVALNVRQQQSDAFMKNFAFSIGLVGYGMENLGRRLLGFSQTIFGELKNFSAMTEQLERLRAALLLEGKTPDEAKTIEGRLRRIAELPTGKFDVIAKGFREFTESGLSDEQALNLLEGITKGAAGSGVQGAAENAVGIIQRVLAGTAQSFTGERSIATLQKDLGPALAGIIGNASPKELNAAGGKNVVLAMIPELLKLPEPMKVTADRLNNIEASITNIASQIEKIIGPALDKVLDRMKSLEGLATSLADRFSKLSPSTQNWIGTLLVAVPTVITVLGVLLSVLGVLAVGLAVGGKLWRAYGFIVGEAGTATAEATAEFGFLAGIGTKLSKVFEPVLTFFTNFGAVLASGGTVGEALSFTEVSLGGIAGGFAKIVGLTSPIGILINILLAYATNAGKARDNINDSFSVLFSSFGKLFDQISAFVSGPVGSSIFGFISQITDFLGGILGDVLSTIILEISHIIDLITAFFGLLENPSTESFKKFFEALFEASFGWIRDFGNLLTATILDALATAFQNKDAKSIWTAALGGAVGEAIAGGGIAGNMHAAANQLRVDTFGDNFNGFLKQQDDLKKSQAEVIKLNIQLNKTRDILHGMDNDWQKLTTNAVNFTAKLARQNAEDEAQRADKAAQTRLGIETTATPTLALKDIPGIFQQELNNALSSIRSTTVDQVKQLSTQLATSVANLEASMEAATGVKGSDTATQAKLAYLVKLKEIIQFARSGNIDPKAVQNLINSIGQAEVAMSNIFGSIPQSDEGRKQLQEVTKATGEVTNAVGEYQKALQSNQESERSAIKTNNDAKDSATKAAEEQARKTKAIADARDKQLEYNVAVVEYNRLEAAFNNEINPQRREALRQQFITQGGIVSQLKEQVAAILHAGEAADSQKEETDKTNEALEQQNKTLKTAAENTDSLTKNVQALVGAFRASFSDIDAFKQKLDALNESRAKLGFGALPTDLLSNLRQQDIGAGAATTIKPLLTENRQVLGVDDRSNFIIENALDVIRKGTALSGTLVTTLQGVAESTISQQLGLSKQIDDNNDTIAVLKRALEDAIGKPGEDQARKNLDTELERQTQLGVKAAAYKNILQAINILLQANTNIIGEQYRNQILQNEADQANLKLKQEQLQLESDLIDKQIENRNKQASLPGGLVISRAEIDAQDKQALKDQIDLIQSKYELEVKNLELLKLQADQRLAENDINQEQHDSLVKVYDKEIELLGKINDQNKNGAALDNTINKIDKLKNTLNNLTGTLMDRVANDFVAMIGKIQNASGKGVTAVQMFKDLAAAAIAGFGQALGQALVDVIANGENFFKSIGKFFGQILIQLGTMLISVGTAALAAGILSKFFPFLMPILNPSGVGEGAAVAAIAVGAGLVAAGALMGGGSGASKAASTNAGNSANSAAGASPQPANQYDPNKDPVLAYQRAQTINIMLDVRADDGIIVKKVIKAVNSNGRLTNLIGNRRLGFSN
jgi:hypothetical protein